MSYPQINTVALLLDFYSNGGGIDHWVSKIPRALGNKLTIHEVLQAVTSRPVLPDKDEYVNKIVRFVESRYPTAIEQEAAYVALINADTTQTQFVLGLVLGSCAECALPLAPNASYPLE